MNADLRALREQEITEQEAVQERIAKFWEPQDQKEAAGFLAVELMDDLELSGLFFDMCSNEIEADAAILEAAKKLILRAQSAIHFYAINDQLPITILTNEPEDARAMARGQM